MPLRALWKLSVVVSSAAEEAVSEILTERFGKSISSYTDFETGISRVSIFFEGRPLFPRRERQALAGALARLKEYGLESRPTVLSLARIRNRDWAESWKLHFKPIQIGSALLIKPSWSRRQPKKGQAVIVLDPGLSFGTGQHPTTSFCLRQVARLRPRRKGKSFLDIGTGSGILAIAAAKLGYAPVNALDHDPQAVRITRENARRNRVADKIHFKQQDVTKWSRGGQRQYDLVCANLISNLLIEQRSRIIPRVKPGGTLVLAGILAVEFKQVEVAYARLGMKLVTHRLQKEWCSGCFIRSSNESRKF